MSNELKKAIRAARPRLRVVSPLANWVMLIMGLFNIILGASLYIAFDEDRLNSSLLIVNDLTTFQFWGVAFILVGLVKLYSIWKNDWNLARKSLLLGVAIKATWAVALVVRAATSPGTLFVTLIWVTLALLQMGTYIWFMPPAMASYKQRKADR